MSLSLATVRRDGDLAPIVFLHGFGSAKEDYADVALEPAFAGRPILAYDAPGCGETMCEDLPGISIPFLVKTAQTVLQQAGIRRFHLVGHSMGGLTALLLAHQDPGRVVSLVDIEGAQGPEGGSGLTQLAHNGRASHTEVLPVLQHYSVPILVNVFEFLPSHTLGQASYVTFQIAVGTGEC